MSNPRLSVVDEHARAIQVKAYGVTITWSIMDRVDRGPDIYVKTDPPIKVTPFEEFGRSREELYRYYKSLGFTPYDL
jgi:hypothetical protein